MKTLYYYSLPIIDLSVTFVIANDIEGKDVLRTERVTHVVTLLGKTAIDILKEVLTKSLNEEVNLLPSNIEIETIKANEEAMRNFKPDDDGGFGLGSRSDT